jgi:hypothetical protein
MDDAEADAEYEIPPMTSTLGSKYTSTTSESSMDINTPPLASPPTLVHRHTMPAAGSLSNLDSPHFRGHRDSVTLAKGRLVHSSPFSDIVKTHRDSVALAKQRMRERRARMEAGSGEAVEKYKDGAGAVGKEGSGGGKHIKIVE